MTVVENDNVGQSVSSTTTSTTFAKLKNNIKDVFKGRVFLGRYIERRLADKIGYRDVVLLSEAEVQLKKDLLQAKHDLCSLSDKIWIGITDTTGMGLSKSGVCIWTEIDYEPFGPFWFQIKSVTFRENEVILKVKCIRHITDAYLEIEPLLTQGVKADTNNTSQSFAKSQESVQEAVNTLKSIFSLQNIIDIITFVFAFIVVVCTGGIEFIYFLGNFVLALVRELSNFVNNATPGFLGILDFLSKIVGGLYILIAMFFRENVRPPPRNPRMIKYTNRNNQNSFDGQFD